MAFETIATATNAKRVPASIQSVYIRPSGELYQTLGAIQEGCEIVLEDYVQNDSQGKNKSIQAKSVYAKIRMMQCSLTEIELLDTMIDGTSAFLFKMVDAAAIPTGGAAATEGWWLFSSTQIGISSVKVDLSGDSEKNAFIEIEFKGSLQDASLTAALKASIDDDEFEATGGSGTFKAIGTYTAAKNGGLPTTANIKSCGIASLTLADTGGAAQTLGPIDNPVIELNYMSEQDSLKVGRVRWVAINIQYEWKQTDAVNLLLYDDFTDAEIDKVITMANGLILTFTNQTGIAANLQSVGTYENTRSFVFKHEGKVLPSAVDGIFSV